MSKVVFYDQRAVRNNDGDGYVFERRSDLSVRELFRIPNHLLEAGEVIIGGFHEGDVLQMPYYLETIADVSQEASPLQTRVYLFGYPNPIILSGEHYLTSYNFAFEHAADVVDEPAPGAYYSHENIDYKISHCDYFGEKSQITCGSANQYNEYYLFRPVSGVKNVFYFFNPELHKFDFTGFASSPDGIATRWFEQGGFLYILYDFLEIESTSVVVRSRNWDRLPELMPGYVFDNFGENSTA